MGNDYQECSVRKNQNLNIRKCFLQQFTWHLSKDKEETASAALLVSPPTLILSVLGTNWQLSKHQPFL